MYLMFSWYVLESTTELRSLKYQHASGKKWVVWNFSSSAWRANKQEWDICIYQSGMHLQFMIMWYEAGHEVQCWQISIIVEIVWFLKKNASPQHHQYVLFKTDIFLNKRVFQFFINSYFCCKCFMFLFFFIFSLFFLHYLLLLNPQIMHDQVFFLL